MTDRSTVFRVPTAPIQISMLAAPDASSLTLQLVLDLKDADIGEIGEAWRETVAAVEAMGMGFVQRDREPPVLEPRTWKGGIEEARIDDGWLNRDRERPFDLDDGLPWRVAWDARGRFCLSFHHALLDGASIVKVARHFLDRLEGGAPAPLGLATWDPVDDVRRERALALGREWFGDIEPVVWEHARGGGCRLAEDLGNDIAEGLRRCAEREGVTPATLLLWAWGRVVAREAGVGSVVVGQVRRGAPQEGKAGFTMNTLPVPIGGEDDFMAVRDRMRAWRECEEVSAAEIPGGNWSSVLMFDQGRMGNRLAGAGRLESAMLLEGRSEELLGAAYLSTGLDLEIDAGEWVGEERARRLMEHWKAVLVRLADGAGLDADELPDEWSERLDAWESGGPAAVGSGDLGVEWAAAVATDPERPAIVWPGGSWTVGEVDRRARRLGAALRSAGLGPGDRFGVRFEDRRRYPEALLAAAMTGTIYVPLDRRLPEERVRAMARHAELAGVLAEKEECAVGACWINPECDEPFDEPAGGGGLLALLFTSGSTGEPKAVMLEHAGVINEAAAMAGVLEDVGRMTQFASPGFDASLEEMLVCLLHGGSLVSGPEVIGFDDFRARVEEMEIEVPNLPTAYWASWCAAMREAGGRLPESVRAAVIGGEALTSAALSDWMAVGGASRRLLNTYGPTEASIAATVEVIEGDFEAGEGPPAIGRPLEGYRVRVGDREGRRLAPKVHGELWIGGVGVAPGYRGDEEKTRAVFREFGGDRWYRTGDVAWWSDDGRLHFGGRRDDQVKIRGHRVEPEEVREAVEALSGVAAAFVAGHGAGAGLCLAAWVRAEAGATLDPAELRRTLLGKLPAACVPTRWAVVGAFPLTERGKVDRRALPEPVAPSGEDGGEPRSETERWLAELWCEVLGVEGVGRNDDFFALGGSSLQALRMFARIATEKGCRLPLSQLLSTPTLNDLAAEIDRGDRSFGDLPPLTTLRVGGAEPPLFCVHGGDGGTLFYRELVDRLPADLPFITIESPELGAEREPGSESIERMGRRYVSALRRQQPRGPYRLAGYSFGGIMVYEMARQLLEAGESVAFLGMFDTENPAKNWRKYSPAERLRVFWRSLDGLPWSARIGMLCGRAIEGVGTHCRVKLELAALARIGRTAPHSRMRMLRVREQHDASAAGYRPPPLDVELVLFKTEAVDDKFEVDEDYGWGGLVRRLEIERVDGRHLSMFEPEHVGTLAERVGDRL